METVVAKQFSNTDVLSSIIMANAILLGYDLAPSCDAEPPMTKRFKLGK